MRRTGVLDRRPIAYPGGGRPHLLISYELLLVSHRGWWPVAVLQRRVPEGGGRVANAPTAVGPS